MLNFRYSYAPWCPACRTLSPIWHNIAGWCADVNIKIGQVDITKNPGSTLVIADKIEGNSTVFKK